MGLNACITVSAVFKVYVYVRGVAKRELELCYPLAPFPGSSNEVL